MFKAVIVMLKSQAWFLITIQEKKYKISVIYGVQIIYIN